MRFICLTLAVAACFLAATSPAGAAQKPPKDLWATVNICDTAAHPDRMGVRASMPGDGARTTMYMRFAAQYYERSKQAWLDVKGAGGLSKWIKVGSGRFARRQAGYTFGFEPTKGKKFTLRGVVLFEWRRGKTVVRSARVNTKGGHPNTTTADPQSYSASLCDIS
jgi:hypothetical protein